MIEINLDDPNVVENFKAIEELRRTGIFADEELQEMYNKQVEADKKIKEEKKIELTPHDLGAAFCNFNLRCYSPCAECAAFINGFCGGEKPTPAELKKIGEEILEEWKGGGSGK